MINVTGVVRNVWNNRDTQVVAESNSVTSTENDGGLPMFTDDGPLAKASHKVFSLSMYSFRGDSSERRESRADADVMVYFYDVWAEKCAFLSSGDVLTISGPASMVSYLLTLHAAGFLAQHACLTLGYVIYDK